MSREERKMQQIIALIERDGGRGGKKSKNGVSKRSGLSKKLKSKSGSSKGDESSTADTDRFLPLKKRWIQEWKEEMQQMEEEQEMKQAQDEEMQQEQEKEAQEPQKEDVQEAKADEMEQVKTDKVEQVQAEEGQAKDEEEKRENPALRVTPPVATPHSHLSPPKGEGSPTPVSISPTSKTKDTESSAPSNTSVQTSSTSTTTVVSKPMSFATGKSEESNPRTPSESSSGQKRSLPEAPLSPDALRRAERRRKRKSNWDLGDPKLDPNADVNSDVPPPIGTNFHPSLFNGRLPSGRPGWRHSYSMPSADPDGKAFGKGFGNASRRSSFRHHSVDRNRSSSENGRRRPPSDHAEDHVR